jgi:hypothetical protein
MTAKRTTTRPRKPAKNTLSVSNGGWVRMMSPKQPGYRTLVSPRQMQAFGPPKDPWGKTMVPAKGIAPRLTQASTH